MGELSFGKLFKSMPKGSPKHIVVGLTTLGKSKSESFEGTGAKFQVLSDLADNGSSSISEIAGRTNMDDGKVKSICKELQRQGMIRQMQGEE
jgi:DNA-binding MarR family transcriptional regulator